MTFQDDRTPEQKTTHTLIVMMTDSFLSGWGGASGGLSYAGWACTPDMLDVIEQRIRNRSDAKRVRVVSGDYRPKPGACKHCHIYVANN